MHPRTEAWNIHPLSAYSKHTHTHQDGAQNEQKWRLVSKTVSGLLSFKTTKTGILARHETISPNIFHVSNVPYGSGRRGPHASDKKFLKFLSSSITYYFTSYQSLVLKGANARIAHTGKLTEAEMVLALCYLYRYKMNMGIIFPTSSTTFLCEVQTKAWHGFLGCEAYLLFWPPHE